MDRSDRLARLDKICRLQRQFLESALADVREILAVLEDGSATLGASDEQRLRKLAHDLKGTGAVYGFASLSQTAARLEAACSAARPVLEMRCCVDDLLSAVLEAGDGLSKLPKEWIAAVAE